MLFCSTVHIEIAHLHPMIKLIRCIVPLFSMLGAQSSNLNCAHLHAIKNDLA